MRIHQLSPLDAVASLKSTTESLGHAEAARRLQEFGRNVVQEVARSPLWLRFLREFVTFFSLILWFAAGLAFLAEWSDPGQGMAKIGYAIIAVIVVSGLFSFWQEYRVERTLARAHVRRVHRDEEVATGTRGKHIGKLDAYRPVSMGQDDRPKVMHRGRHHRVGTKGIRAVIHLHIATEFDSGNRKVGMHPFRKFHQLDFIIITTGISNRIRRGYRDILAESVLVGRPKSRQLVDEFPDASCEGSG